MEQQQMEVPMRDGYPDGFWRWLESNQSVLKAFVKEAKRMRRTRSRYSASGIVEVIRWHTNLHQVGEPEFKINNNYRKGLAMLAMKENPELEGFFSLRSQA
jgi:hypothetical protein